MAFPSVAAKATPHQSTSGTTRDVDLPASVASGDRVMVWAFLRDTTFSSWPGGWVQVATTTHTNFVLEIRELIASGGETTVSVGVAGSGKLIAHAWKITGSDTATAAEGTAATDNNPPSETASWGSADNLWIAGAATNADLTTYPTGFNDNQVDTDDAGESLFTRICSDEDTSATVDPTIFDSSGQSRNVSATVVVRPAAAVVGEVVLLPGPGVRLRGPNAFVKPWLGSPVSEITAIGLVVDDAGQAHTADNVTLTQVHELTVADATQAHAADSLALTQVHQLVVADAAQAHAADNVTLTQVHVLTVADAAHGQTADNVVLTTGAVTLVVQDATQAHVADNVTLTQVHQLVVADATHGHTADSVSLTQTHVLTVSDALQAHSAENVDLFVGDLPIPVGHQLEVPAGTHRITVEDGGEITVQPGVGLIVHQGTHVVEATK